MANRDKKKILVVGPAKGEFIGGVATFTRGQLTNTRLLDEFDLQILDSVSERAPDSGQARRLLNTAGLALRLTVRLIRERTEVVHLHCSAGGSFYQKTLLGLLARLFGVSTLLHIHVGFFTDFYKANPFRFMIRLGLRAMSRVAVVSDSLAVFLRESCGLVPTVIPNFAQPDFFESGSDSAAGEDIVFLGSLSERKGVPVLLEALGRLRAAGCANRLVLAGIPQKDAVQARIESLVHDQSLGRIELALNASPENIRVILSRAAVFVLPSWSEGLPVSLLEAMAAGVPVVATRVGGIPEAVTDGEQGLLVEPGDSEQLAMAMQKLLASPELRSAMGQAARRRALERFHPHVTGQALAELYRQL